MSADPDDVSGFRPENDLEAAMLRAATDPSRYHDFLAALRDADVFVPGRDPVEEEGYVDRDTVTLPVVDWQGRPAVPVFSSLSRLRQAVAEVPSYMAFHFRDLAGLWQEQWMLINPGNPVGLPLSPAQVCGIAAPGSTADSWPAFGEPAVEAPELLRAVSDACRQSGAVLAAHRALVASPLPGELPRLVIGVLLAPGADAGPVIAGIRQAAQEQSPVEVISLDPADPGTVGAYMLELDRPFFRGAG